MLRYCETCSFVFDGSTCPVCGGKQFRDPRANDPCFLCEKPIMWGEMLEEVLEDHGIPAVIKKKLGIGMALKVGPMAERLRIYVPFDRLEEAKEIVDEMFSGTDGEA